MDQRYGHASCGIAPTDMDNHAEVSLELMIGTTGRNGYDVMPPTHADARPSSRSRQEESS
jgi:hypothetical protein